MGKRTFKENDCLGNIPNAEIYDTLVNYARSKGVPVSHYGLCHREYPNLSFNIRGGLLCIGPNRTPYPSNNRNWITFEQFFEYCDNWKECQVKEIRTGAGGIAKIDFETRMVMYGNAAMAFDTIREIFNAISEPNTTE